MTCDAEYSDDYYSEGHTCDLAPGHDGPHRTVLEWPRTLDAVPLPLTPAEAAAGAKHLLEYVQRYSPKLGDIPS